jgi:hypothetical protein
MWPDGRFFIQKTKIYWGFRSMREIDSRAGEFVIPLSYEINIGLARHPKHYLQPVPHDYHRRLLGEAWTLFWHRFIDSICHPDFEENLRRSQRSDLELIHESFGSDENGRDIGNAFVVPPGILEQVPPKDQSDPQKMLNLLERIEVGAWPSFGFVDEISPSPMKVRGERLADGVGYAFNGNGKKELGIVFSAELLDFYAEEGSLRASGTAVLKFFGTTLLVPLVTIAVSPPATVRMEKWASVYNIEQQLDVQDVRCNVTAGFHFARKELIMKLEHRLSVGGRSGVCEIQSALTALGYSPGRIDGIHGSDTKRAEGAFAAAWGLSPHDTGTPVFFNLVARALMGERPPYKY